MSANQIKEKYKLKELQAMYKTIYEKEASKSKNKEYIINIIEQYYKMNACAKAFSR